MASNIKNLANLANFLKPNAYLSFPYLFTLQIAYSQFQQNFNVFYNLTHHNDQYILNLKPAKRN